MKNYVIATLAVAILLLGSIIYKKENTMVMHHFPIPGRYMVRGAGEPPVYLFFFFSRQNCSTCLTHTVKVLNGLKPPFYPVGVVPDDELLKEGELRQVTGVRFPVGPFREFKKYIPWKTPTLYGVSAAGRIIFAHPSFQEWEIGYDSFLPAAYGKYYRDLEADWRGSGK